MPRYIDADELRKQSKMLYSIHAFEPVEAYTQDQIDNAPTIDLTEVVRCGECVNKTFCSCVMDERYGDDDFCSYGERNDGEKG
jgi:hypothetical protein